jgi:hypothetical protein
LAKRKRLGTQVSKSNTGSDPRISILGIDKSFKDLYGRWVYGTSLQNTLNTGVDRNAKPWYAKYISKLRNQHIS